MRTIVWTAIIAAVLIGIPRDADAYIGPGAGISVIGTVVTVIGAIFLAIVGFVWYPIKRALMKLRRRQKPQGEVNAT